MPSLPTGTVTFLFTDLQGSTRLWEAHPEAMRSAIARHDAILRDAVAAHDGYVVKSTGDGLLAAFATAASGVAASVQGQLALLVEPWHGELILKARMGLNSGAAELRDGDYFSPTVIRCERLMSTGSGGQVLLSEATRELVEDSLPPECTLTRLGEYRLRDLTRPEIIYQVDHPAFARHYPPLRTLDNPNFPNNLPLQLTSFIGRDQVLGDIKNLLSRTHLLTLTGAGGSGKTRLALQAAADVLDHFADGVWFIDLAPLADPALVARVVASVLQVAEQPGRSIAESLVDALKSRRLLVVLDNCEHLIGACAELANLLLRSCPELRFLTTSREALAITGEQIYRVPTLRLPDPGNTQKVTRDSLIQYEGVQLFVERAQAVRSDFAVTDTNAPALAQLCLRLDGIPLAIELAAARARSLAIEDINNRLDSRFRLLTGGSRAALPRQQTLRALVDWSYDLLSESEKTIFARLSVFAGGWTLAAAEAICGFDPIEDWEVLDLLTNLVYKSLALAEDSATSNRYQMLDTLRHYATERLAEPAGGQPGDLRARHRDYYANFAEGIEPKLTSAEQRAWLNVLETEHDNFRGALASCATAESSEALTASLVGLRLVNTLGRFWEVRGHLGEGGRQIRRALARWEAVTAANAHIESRDEIRLVARAHNTAGSLARIQGDYAAAESHYTESLRLYRTIEDRPGIGLALNGQGTLAFERRDLPLAERLYEESLSIRRDLDDRAGVALTLMNLGNVAGVRRDFPTAQGRYEESLRLRRELGNKNGIAYTLMNLATNLAEQGQYAAARAKWSESLNLFREVGHHVAIALALDGIASASRGATADARAAVVLWAAAHAIRESTGAFASPVGRDSTARAQAQARALLGEEAWNAAWAEGAALTPDEAVAVAMGDND